MSTVKMLLVVCFQKKNLTGIWFHFKEIIDLFFLSIFIFLITVLFFYKFIYFNWRLIILQYCSGLSIF